MLTINFIQAFVRISFVMTVLIFPVDLCEYLPIYTASMALHIVSAVAPIGKIGQKATTEEQSNAQPVCNFRKMTFLFFYTSFTEVFLMVQPTVIQHAINSLRASNAYMRQ